jgi:hypothetical protein
MADIAPQIWMKIERRLTSIEHRLTDLEEKRKRQSKEWVGVVLHPRLWWPLAVVGLGAVTQQLSPQEALRTLLSLVVK